MAVGHVTYLDLSPEQRRQAAKAVREKVRAALANPFLTNEQKSALTYQLERITHWEHGRLAMGAPFRLPVTAIEKS
jgi:hypothetical protein